MFFLTILSENHKKQAFTVKSVNTVIHMIYAKSYTAKKFLYFFSNCHAEYSGATAQKNSGHETMTAVGIDCSVSGWIRYLPPRRDFPV